MILIYGMFFYLNYRTIENIVICRVIKMWKE